MLVDFDVWSQSEGAAASQFGESFIREFQERFGRPVVHPWDQPGPGSVSGAGPSPGSCLIVLHDKCCPRLRPRMDGKAHSVQELRRAQTDPRVWSVHFAVSSAVSRRDAQEQM